MPDPDPVLMTPEEARAAHPNILVESKYPDDLLEELVGEFVGKFREFRGVAPLTTTETDTVVVGYATRRLLLRPMLQEVTEVATLAGDPLDTTVTVEDPVLGTVLVAPALAPGSYRVTMVHGPVDALPGTLRACGLFVRREAQAQVNPATGNSYLRNNPDLGIIERDSTMSMADNRPTGWLDVDRILCGLPDFRAEP